MNRLFQLLLVSGSAVVWLGSTRFGLALLAAIWSCNDPFSIEGSLD